MGRSSRSRRAHVIDRLGIRIRRRTRSQFHVPLELRGEPALGPIEFAPHGDARFKREILLTYGGIALTLLASVFVAWDVLGLIVRALNERHWAKTAEQNLFLCVVAFLIYGNLAYQVTRIGYFDRRRRHRPVPPAELDAMLDDPLPPPVAILIPSYKEPAGVIRQALL